MAFICVGKLTIIDSENGLLPDHHQAIILTSAGILWIGSLIYNLYFFQLQPSVWLNYYNLMG